MTTKELKLKIQNDVNRINDTKVLEMVDLILETYKGNTFTISDKHKTFLKESENSKLYSNEEAKMLVDEWLKE